MSVEFNVDDAPTVVEQKPTTKTTVKVKGIEKILTTLTQLNEEFAILNLNGCASTYVSRKDFQPITDQDLARRLANRVIHTGVNDNGNVYQPAVDVWKGNAHRHVYTGIAFTNKPVAPHVYNLYKGLGVVPKEGPCDLIHKHIEEVICCGDKKKASDLNKLMAWQIQNIGQPSRTVCVFKSKKQQVGKGIFLNGVQGKIYGPSAAFPPTMDQIIGRFNDSLRGAVYVFLDEVLFGGNKKDAASLKTLSTATEIGIETKGLPIVKCRIAVNLWLASNEDNAAHIEETDARYWVFNVDGEKRNAAYFTALAKQIDNGGAEAFAYYLLNLDVSNFVPWRDINKDNDAKKEMIKEAINPYDATKWLEDCCETGKIIGMRKEGYDGREDRNDPYEDWVKGAKIVYASLYQAYGEWQKGIRSRTAPKTTPSNRFGEVLGTYGLGPVKVKDIRSRLLPSCEDVLALLSSGGVDTQLVENVKHFGRPDSKTAENSSFHIGMST
jgi:hypothetical protein